MRGNPFSRATGSIRRTGSSRISYAGRRHHSPAQSEDSLPFPLGSTHAHSRSAEDAPRPNTRRISPLSSHAIRFLSPFPNNRASRISRRSPRASALSPIPALFCRNRAAHKFPPCRQQTRRQSLSPVGFRQQLKRAIRRREVSCKRGEKRRLPAPVSRHRMDPVLAAPTATNRVHREIAVFPR
jgi:hypothetical protein